MEDFPPAIWATLKDYGASSMGVGKAHIPVLSSISEPEILDYQVVDTTPRLRKFRQDVIRSRVVRTTSTLGEYGTQAFFRKKCTAWLNPKINFQIIPLRIESLTLVILRGDLKGEITNEIKNDGEDGEKGTSSRWRWQSCPQDRGGYDWDKIAGSANFAPRWRHQALEVETNRLISNVSQNLNTVRKDQRLSIAGRFETTGLKDVIMSLLSILRRGSMVIKNGYDLTIKHSWKGQEQTINRRVDSRIRLPVEGGINVDWL